MMILTTFFIHLCIKYNIYIYFVVLHVHISVVGYYIFMFLIENMIFDMHFLKRDVCLCGTRGRCEVSDCNV